MSDTRPPWWRRWRGFALVGVGSLVVACALMDGSDEGPAPVEAAADEVEELPSATPSPSSPSSSPHPAVAAPSPLASPSSPPTPSPTPTPTPSPTPTRDPLAGPRGDDAPVVRTGVVTNIVDGDTLDLDDGTRVRLAIVDTPEVHGGMQRCGQEASAFAREGVLGARVSILRPSGAPAVDTFDRLVGEVIRSDGYSLNVALVAAGLGEVDERFTGEDPDLATRARAARDGAAVASCAAVAAPSPGPEPAPEVVDAESPPAGHCHPAYMPCVPPAPPDLNCADVDGPIQVDHTHGDPHGLDRDTDGVGCEG